MPDANAGNGDLDTGLEEGENAPSGGEDCFIGEKPLLCICGGGANPPFAWGKASGPTAWVDCEGDIEGRFFVGEGTLWMEWLE